MPVDLRTCIPGQELRSIHGAILVYVKALNAPGCPPHHYDHEVRYPNGGRGTRTDDGFTYRNPNKRIPTDHDIVEILPTVKILPEFLVVHEDACEGQLTA